MKKAKEKGSVTLFVLVSTMFFLIILILVYTQQAEKMNIQKRQIAEIQKNYQTKDIEQIYQETYNQNKPKPTPTGIWVALEGDTLRFYTKEENAIAGGGKVYGDLKGVTFTRDNTDGVEQPTTPWWVDRAKILHAEFIDPVAPEYMAYFFSDLEQLETVDMTQVKTNNVTDMYGLFLNCRALKQVATSDFDTSNVENMGWMFLNCSSLTELNVSNFDTSKVTNMYAMFNGCNKLTKLEVSNFDTSNVTSMGSMFANMTALTQLDLSNFDTSKVTVMSNMFFQDKNLSMIDVSNFNTSNVTTMINMFMHCESLTVLDISSFDTRKVTDMRCMFQLSKKLAKIYVGANWELAANSKGWIEGCRTTTTTRK